MDAPPPQPAVVATLPSATVVAAAKAWTAWSELRDGAYVLVTRAPDGTTTTPAVATRGVPFDLDLGADSGGRPTAAYSRCRTEPRPTGGANTIGPQWTSGRGCSIVLLNLLTGRETKVRRAARDASEVLPSIAGSRLAYIAVPRKGSSRALLMSRDLRTGKTTRVDSGPRKAASAGFAEGPTSVDAWGGSVVAVWRFMNREFHSFDTDVRVRTVGAKKKPYSAAGASNSEECSYDTVVSPTLRGRSLYYLETTGTDWVLGRTPATRRAARFARSSSGDADRVPTSAAVDGGRLVVSDTRTEIGGGATGETRVLETSVGTFATKSPVGC